MTLFCYGSLEFADVMRAVTGRSFSHEPARLDGWVRLRLRGRAFPGVRPKLGTSVSGTLWRGIDDESAERLDRFEGETYERRPLVVRTRSSVSVTAQVYVIKEALRGELSQEPWDRARFVRESLRDFVRSLNRS
jgi:gamma-glutamylcyclotransferase (GGCT)/AIG2-like uncharacterized protein YtfP